MIGQSPITKIGSTLIDKDSLPGNIVYWPLKTRPPHRHNLVTTTFEGCGQKFGFAAIRIWLEKSQVVAGWGLIYLVHLVRAVLLITEGSSIAYPL